MNTSDSHLAEIKELVAAQAHEAAELKQAAGSTLTDAVAGWLAAQCFLAAHEKLAGAGDARRWDRLRPLVQDCALLRRGDQAAARLQLDREKLDWQRANGEAHKQKEFREWVKRPDIRAELFPEHTGGFKPETMRKYMKGLNLMPMPANFILPILSKSGQTPGVPKED